jgi:hypothetical protein
MHGKRRIYWGSISEKRRLEFEDFKKKKNNLFLNRKRSVVLSKLGY